MDTRTGSDIYNIISLAHCLLIVFYHDNRVAELTQMLERTDKLAVISLVQADARLIEDVKHACKRRAYLSRKSDSLRFTTRKSTRSSGKVEVIETYADKEVESSLDLL